MTNPQPTTGPDHYTEAMRDLAEAKKEPGEKRAMALLASAQVHATLALVAATVDASPSSHARSIWERVLG